jgi:hypothetical protein
MKVYLTGSKEWMGVKTPICIESNLAWAIPYWSKRQKSNKNIY